MVGQGRPWTQGWAWPTRQTSMHARWWALGPSLWILGCGAAGPALGPAAGAEVGEAPLLAEGAKPAREALVALRPGQSLEPLGFRTHRHLPALGVVAVEVPPGQSLAGLIAKLEASGRCRWVDELRAVPGESILAHPERLVNWRPGNPLKDTQVSLEAMRVPQAWGTTKGQGVRVALVDGPISTDLGALRGQFEATWHVPKHREALDPGSLTKFHGTVTAGVIGAVRGGTLGVAPEARLLGVQVRDAQEGGDELHLAEGIVWAVAHGAKVMTVYSGTVQPRPQGPSPVLREALQHALAHDVLVVATAGNDRSELRPEAHPIATCPGVLTVSSGDGQGRRYRFSNQGAAVALSAPAVEVLAPFPGPLGLFSYLKLTCTSWAAAHAAGVATLLRSAHPGWTADQVRERLCATARDLGSPGRDATYGWGLIDAEAALR